MNRALIALVLVAGCHKADQTKDDPARHAEAAPSVTEAAAPTPPDPAQPGSDRVPAGSDRDAVATPPTGSEPVATPPSSGDPVGTPPSGSAKSPASQSVIRVQTIDQAVAAKGKQVRLRGTAQREKLGDTINIGDLRVLCVGAQFPNASIGKTVEADGTLNVTARHQATTNPRGEVSAGTAPGTKRWVLERCAPR